jgi:hypothetical protein
VEKPLFFAFSPGHPPPKIPKPENTPPRTRI